MEERIIELLTKKLAREASDEELMELSRLLTNNPETFSTKRIIEEIWNSKEEQQEYELYYERHKRKYQQEFDASGEVNSGYDFKTSKQYINKIKRYLIIGLPVII